MPTSPLLAASPTHPCSPSRASTSWAVITGWREAFRASGSHNYAAGPGQALRVEPVGLDFRFPPHHTLPTSILSKELLGWCKYPEGQDLARYGAYKS